MTRGGAAGEVVSIRALAESKRLPKSHLDRWLAMDPGSRDALLTVARNLRMRTGQIVIAIELVEEIAVRERIAPAAVLDRGGIRRIVAGPGSAPARASSLLGALRAARYPRLAATQQKLRAAIASLRLPAGVSIVLPKELGSDELGLSIRVRSAAGLELTLAALAKNQRGLAQIIELLGGCG